MAEKFDPYHEWLGIPPAEQPPSHYRLLGIPLLESRASVIENAANQRMAHLRTFQTGKHSAASQRLLNEVAAARVCLLKPEKRAAYDAKLRENLAAHESPAEEAPAAIDPGLAEIFQLPVVGTSAIGSKRRKKNTSHKPVALLTGLAVAVVAAVAAAGVYYSLATDSGPKAGAKDTIAAANSAGSPPSSTASHLAENPPKPAAVTSNHPTHVVPGAELIANAGGAGSRERKPETTDTTPAPPATQPATPPAGAQSPTAPGDNELPPTETPPNISPEEPPTKSQVKPTVQKHVPPSPEEQARLVRAIDEIYKTAGVKDPAAKAELARKLLETGRNDAAKPDEQFVLFRRASETARDAGEAELTLEAVDAITAAGFEIRAVSIKARLLKRLLETAPCGDATHVQAVRDGCMRFTDSAAADNDFNDAIDVLDAANKWFAEPRRRAQAAYQNLRNAAVHAKDPAQKEERESKAEEARAEVEAIKTAQVEIQERVKNLQQARRDHEVLLAAEEKLKTSPDDPAACLTAGRWYCFNRGDWDTGLKYLAKGSDPVLKTLATDDLAAKPAATAHAERGDAWWDAAEKAEQNTKPAMRRRAEALYRRALPGLSQGLLKLKVENRLTEGSASKPKSPAATPNPKVVKTPRKRVYEPMHPSGIRIVSAFWGAEPTWVDVTLFVQEMLDTKGIVSVESTSLRGDPTPNVHKKLKITYRRGGRENTIVADENEHLKLMRF